MIIAKVMVFSEFVQDLGSESCKFWGYNLDCENHRTKRRPDSLWGLFLYPV